MPTKFSRTAAGRLSVGSAFFGEASVENGLPPSAPRQLVWRSMAPRHDGGARTSRERPRSGATAPIAARLDAIARVVPWRGCRRDVTDPAAAVKAAAHGSAVK